MRMSAVPVEYVDFIVPARPKQEPKLRLVESATREHATGRISSRSTPVRVVTSDGRELVFNSYIDAWRQLRLPDHKCVRSAIAAIASHRGDPKCSASFEHDGITYTFTFVELC
ncbi:hypothetical protein [Burkholderia anthina]|uniref:hypothetical protein n=1 Tax=Burkholderia anthina TaxID=179879 RepID=UPI001588A9B8|nr:hypothetical protein [Burkholderia anthina]